MVNELIDCEHVLCGIHQQLLSDDSNFGCFLLRSIDLSEFMRLDAAASAALHLEPSPGESGGRYSSLYGLLNQCQTPQGQRLLRQWIKQPLLDHRRISVCLSLCQHSNSSTLLAYLLPIPLFFHLSLLPSPYLSCISILYCFRPLLTSPLHSSPLLSSPLFSSPLLSSPLLSLHQTQTLSQSSTEERLSLVELLVKDVELRHMLQEEFLKHMPDFLRVVKKFLSQKARLQVCDGWVCG